VYSVIFVNDPGLLAARKPFASAPGFKIEFTT